jgi:hypothetical protein
LISTPGETSIHSEESDGNGKNPWASVPRYAAC